MWFKEIIDPDGQRRLVSPPVNVKRAGFWIVNYQWTPEVLTSSGYREWSADELAAWNRQYDVRGEEEG